MRTARTAAHRAVAQESFRRRQPDEFHAFFLGVLHLAHRARHVRPVAAVQALYRCRALAHRGAHAIHRGVAAADHHHPLARRVQQAGGEVRHVIAEIVAVRRGQVVERRHDARQPRARPADLARLVDAGCDQHRVMPRAQLVEARYRCRPRSSSSKLDAGRLGERAPAQHDVLLQLEVGDAVDHQPADAVVAVVDGDLVAAAAQLLGRGQAARAGADDADRGVQLVDAGRSASTQPRSKAVSVM